MNKNKKTEIMRGEHEEISEYLAKKIRELRDVNNLSQVALSQKLKISESTLSRWENGSRRPSYEDIERICLLFKITPNDLMGISYCGENEISLNNLSEEDKSAVYHIVRQLSRQPNGQQS